MSNIGEIHIYDIIAKEVDCVVNKYYRYGKFDDLPVTEHGGKLVQLHASYGDVIDSIRFSYSYDVEGSRHGGDGGGKRDDITLEGANILPDWIGTQWSMPIMEER